MFVILFIYLFIEVYLCFSKIGFYKYVSLVFVIWSWFAYSDLSSETSVYFDHKISLKVLQRLQALSL